MNNCVICGKDLITKYVELVPDIKYCKKCNHYFNENSIDTKSYNVYNDYEYLL